MQTVIERKHFKADFETTAEPGVFKARFSVFDNVDEGGDRMRAGSLKRTFAENPNPPVVWSHQWGTPPIGETLEVEETPKGGEAVGRLFLDDHPLGKPIYAGLKTKALREFSFGYAAVKSTIVEEDGEKIRDLEDVDVYEWGPTLVGMNRQTELLGIKGLGAVLDATGLDGALAAYVRDAMAAKAAAGAVELAGELHVCGACGAHSKNAVTPGPHAGPDGSKCSNDTPWVSYKLTPIDAQGTSALTGDATKTDELPPSRRAMLETMFTR